MTNRSSTSLYLAFITLVLSACAGAGDDGGDFLACVGKCDSDGPLAISTRWVPESGFVKAALKSGFELTIEPASSVSITERPERDGQVEYIARFESRGFYTIKATKNGQTAGQLGVRVANRGPDFDIEGPSRAEFRQVDQDWRVRVHGRIADPLGGELSAKVGPFPIHLDSDGHFDVMLPIEFGVNFVDIRATDRVGNEFTHTRSVIAAPSFSLGESRASVRLADDALNDLIDKAEHIILERVIIGPVAEPVVESPAKAYLDGVALPGQTFPTNQSHLDDDLQGTLNPGGIDIHARAQPGRLHMTVSLTGKTIGWGEADGPLFINPDFEFAINNLHIEFDLVFRSSEAGLVADIENAQVSESGFDFDAGFWGDLIGIFVNISELARTGAREGIERIIGEQMPIIIESMNERFDIDIEPLMAHIAGTLEYGPESVETAAGSTTVAVAATFSDYDYDHTARGAPYRDESALRAPATSDDLTVSIGYNALNEFLYRIWRQGALTITLTEHDLGPVIEKIPLLSTAEDVIIDVQAELRQPPVISTRNGKLSLSAGDIAVNVKIDTGGTQVVLDARVGFRASVALSAVNNELQISPSLDDFRLDIAGDIGQEGFIVWLNVESFKEMVRGMVPSFAQEISKQAQQFPLPRFDLGSAGIVDAKLGISSAHFAAEELGLTVSGDIEVISSADE